MSGSGPDPRLDGVTSRTAPFKFALEPRESWDNWDDLRIAQFLAEHGDLFELERWDDSLDDDSAPAAVLVVAEDGTPLVVEGQHHLVFGPKLTGKTTFALIACAQTVSQGGRAVYLSYEMGRRAVVHRLISLGLIGPLRDSGGRFRLLSVDAMRRTGIHPDDARYYRTPPAPVERALLWAEETADEGPLLTVFDSVTRAGGATNSDHEYAGWLERVVRPWEAHGAVLLLDHVGKRKGRSRSREPRGTSAKGDQADIELEFNGQAWNAEAEGSVDVWVEKDRNAYLATVPGRRAAVLAGVPSGQGRVDVRVLGVQSDDLRDQIREAVADAAAPLTRTAVGNAVRRRRADVWAAIDAMVDEGELATDDQGKLSLP